MHCLRVTFVKNFIFYKNWQMCANLNNVWKKRNSAIGNTANKVELDCRLRKKIEYGQVIEFNVARYSLLHLYLLSHMAVHHRSITTLIVTH